MANEAESNAEAVATETRRAVQRRYWRRADAAQAAWWPWGLLPLLGLLACLLYGVMVVAPEIQYATGSRVAQTLRTSGYDALEVAASGQDIEIRGSAPAADFEGIRAIARGAACETWLGGELVCPVSVRLALSASLPPKPAVAAASAPVPANHVLRFVREASGVRAEGTVPDRAAREAIAAAAKRGLGDVAFLNRLRVDRGSEPAPLSEGDRWAIGHVWPLLGELERGYVLWQEGKLSLRGRAPEDRFPALRERFEAGAPAGWLGHISLESSEEALRCNAAFSDALRGATIQFATGSAQIDGGSGDLLRRLANLASGCSVAIDVEGHTDSVGSERANLALSQARAEAVVGALSSLGVKASQLNARGFGPRQPVASNDTPDGRARNRRIEIKAANVLH